MLHVGEWRFSVFLFNGARAVKAVVIERALGLETHPRQSEMCSQSTRLHPPVPKVCVDGWVENCEAKHKGVSS